MSHTLGPQSITIYEDKIKKDWARANMPQGQMNNLTQQEKDDIDKRIKDRNSLTFALAVKLFPNHPRLSSAVFGMLCCRSLIVMDPNKFANQSGRMSILYEFSLRHCLIQWRMMLRTNGLLYIMLGTEADPIYITPTANTTPIFEHRTWDLYTKLYELYNCENELLTFLSIATVGSANAIIKQHTCGTEALLNLHKVMQSRVSDQRDVLDGFLNGPEIMLKEKNPEPFLYKIQTICEVHNSYYGDGLTLRKIHDIYKKSISNNSIYVSLFSWMNNESDKFYKLEIPDLILRIKQNWDTFKKNKRHNDDDTEHDKKKKKKKSFNTEEKKNKGNKTEKLNKDSKVSEITDLNQCSNATRNHIRNLVNSAPNNSSWTKGGGKGGGGNNNNWEERFCQTCHNAGRHNIEKTHNTNNCRIGGGKGGKGKGGGKGQYQNSNETRQVEWNSSNSNWNQNPNSNWNDSNWNANSNNTQWKPNDSPWNNNGRSYF